MSVCPTVFDSDPLSLKSPATLAHAEKPTDPQTELIVILAVITASVDRCHFEIDSRINWSRSLERALSRRHWACP
jgi:hypothetical protein